MRRDATSLYVALRYENRAFPQGEALAVANADVTLKVNGCPVAAPKATGALWNGEDSLSFLSLPLATLPDGELEFFVSAHGAGTTIRVKKEGAQLSQVPLAKSIFYHLDPGNPRLGIEPGIIINEPSCPEVRP